MPALGVYVHERVLLTDRAQVRYVLLCVEVEVLELLVELAELVADQEGADCHCEGLCGEDCFV